MHKSSRTQSAGRLARIAMAIELFNGGKHVCLMFNDLVGVGIEQLPCGIDLFTRDNYRFPA
jgi:hypothetical protein